MPTLLYKQVTDPDLKEAFDKFAASKGVPAEEVVAYEDKDGSPKLTTAYGKFGSFGMNAVAGVPAAVAGLGGAAAGSVAGPVGTLAGGLGASAGTQMATDKLIGKFSPEIQARLEASREVNPKLSFVGNAASQISTGAGIAGPGIRALLKKGGESALKQAALKNIGKQAVVGAGLELGVEGIQGDIDPAKIALAGAAGPLFSKTHKFGKPVEAFGERLGTSAADRLGIKRTGEAIAKPVVTKPQRAIEQELSQAFTENPNMTPVEALERLRTSGHTIGELVTDPNKALELISSLGAKKREINTAQDLTTQDPAEAVREADKLTKMAERIRKKAELAVDPEDKAALMSAADNMEKSAIESLAARVGNRPTPEQLDAQAKAAAEKANEQPDPTGTDAKEAAYSAPGTKPTKPGAKNVGEVNPNPSAKVVNPSVIPGDAAAPNAPANAEAKINPAPKQTQTPVDAGQKLVEKRATPGTPEEFAAARDQAEQAEIAPTTEATGLNKESIAKVTEAFGAPDETGNAGFSVVKPKGSGSTGRTIIGSQERAAQLSEFVGQHPDIDEAVRMKNVVDWLHLARGEKDPAALRAAAAQAAKESGSAVYKIMAEQAINESVAGKIPLTTALNNVAEKFRKNSLSPQQQKATKVVEELRKAKELSKLSGRKPGEQSTAESFKGLPKA